MFDGTAYAIAEIVWWLTAAAAVGFALGWVVHRYTAARKHFRDIREAHKRIAELTDRLGGADEPRSRPTAADDD